jgi:energy-coupling factor transporter ATP-binding protein EcfA2
MIIKKFWAKGYRSLRDVTLDALGTFNVFYGPNGSGKSNVLDALHTLLGLMPLAVDTAYGHADERVSFREGGRRARQWVQEDDFFAREDDQRIELGAVIEDPISGFGGTQFRGKPVTRVEVAVQLSRVRPEEINLKFVRLFVNFEAPGLPFTDPEIRKLLSHLVPQAFAHLGVTRTLEINADRRAAVAEPRRVGTIPDGEVVAELFRAKNARDRALRDRFERVRDFMSNTLRRGRFDVFMSPDTGTLELREMLPEPNPRGLDVRLDRAGHGVVQLYAIVAAILLSGANFVSIEEPEAHLHAPTLGIQLRRVLKGLVDDESTSVRQMFIATHSNLFDLDPDRYWDVSLVDGETKVDSKPLPEIDRQHLYEPGPAKHALAQLMRYAPEDEVVFRRPDGSPVTASEMLRLLQEDAPVAVDFLRNLHGAALRIVRLDSRPRGDAA